MWNKNMQFTIQVPDLALVRFLVEDYDAASHNDFIGQYTLPFTSMQMGEQIPTFKSVSSRRAVIYCASCYK